MTVKVGNRYVSEAAYTHAKQKVASSQPDKDPLKQLSEKYPDMNFTTNTAPFQGNGTNNIAIAPNILQQMKTDPDKQLEYEALIYDCIASQNSLGSQYTQDGGKLIASGSIINSDGSLGMWSISKHGDEEQRSFKLLPKRNKESWLSKMLEEQQSSDSLASNRREWSV